MKVLLTDPYMLAVRPAVRGWEIVCQPGPLALLFTGVARDLGATNGDGPRIEEIGGRTFEIIPFTDVLDESLVHLIDALIDLRYVSGQVQLSLFDVEAF